MPAAQQRLLLPPMHSSAHPYGRLAAELGASPFSTITYLAQTQSTNDDASRLLGDPQHAGLSIVAEHQTRGSGRKGRTWTSQPGSSLLVTTIIPRAIAADALWAVPFWTALAVRAALAQHNVETTLHWPNDLLLGDRRKIAGILCVSRVIGKRARVACGVGINVYRRPGGQSDVVPRVAFCDDVARVDRAPLLLTILREYEATLGRLDEPLQTAALWERAAGLPGIRYRIARDDGSAEFEASALRLANDGALVVERDNGSIDMVNLADARALR